MSSTGVDSSSSSGENWKAAKNLAGKFGYIPASFTVAIRTLVKDQLEHDADLRPVTKFQIARVLRTPSFKAMIYWGSQSLRGGYLKGQETLSIGDLMDMYEPFDLASMIGCFLLYRKSRRLLGSNWDWFKPKIDRVSQIGAQVGVALPAVGIGTTLMTSSLRLLSSSLLVIDSEAKAKKYIDEVTQKGLDWDDSREQELWGCTTLEISTMVLSTLGFGIDISQAFTLSNDKKSNILNMQEGTLPFRFKMGDLWVDTFLRGLDQPKIKIPGKFYPMEADRKAAMTQIEKIASGGKNWLASQKSDVSPEKTPALFKEKIIEGDFEVPEELKDVFSLEQITGMEEDAFDDLVDQMDYENEGKTPAGTVILSAKELDELEEMVDE